MKIMYGGHEIDFKEFVQFVCHEKKWRQADLMRKSKLSAPTVHRFQEGKIEGTIASLIQFLDALGMEFDLILREKKYGSK